MFFVFKLVKQIIELLSIVWTFWSLQLSNFWKFQLLEFGYLEVWKFGSSNFPNFGGLDFWKFGLLEFWMFVLFRNGQNLNLIWRVGLKSRFDFDLLFFS